MRGIIVGLDGQLPLVPSIARRTGSACMVAKAAWDVAQRQAVLHDFMDAHRLKAANTFSAQSKWHTRTSSCKRQTRSQLDYLLVPDDEEGWSG